MSLVPGVGAGWTLPWAHSPPGCAVALPSKPEQIPPPQPATTLLPSG